eukprot:4803998-Amphidinium_carterae.1
MLRTTAPVASHDAALLVSGILFPTLASSLAFLAFRALEVGPSRCPVRFCGGPGLALPFCSAFTFPADHSSEAPR